MKDSVYIETSIISYLAARPSRDLTVAAHHANANKRPTIENICRTAGHHPPIICTPEELLGDRYVE